MLLLTGSIVIFPLRLFTPGAVRYLVGVLLAGLIWLLPQLMAPAYAADAPATQRYIAADGTDLTAMVQCLPKELSQGSFSRALREAQNDFLEKVFDVKDDYSSYKLDSAEVEYLACVERQGSKSQVQR